MLFRSGSGSYAVRIDEARRVLPASELAPLPAPREGVAGLLQGAGEPLPVMEGLHSGGTRVLELDAGGRLFGLLVGEVTGVVRSAATTLGPCPDGQEDEVISATVHTGDGGEPALLLDGATLARRLLA